VPEINELLTAADEQSNEETDADAGGGGGVVGDFEQENERIMERQSR
jgi:hypothetical protein